jgi:hypothetical protein
LLSHEKIPLSPLCVCVKSSFLTFLLALFFFLFPHQCQACYRTQKLCVRWTILSEMRRMVLLGLCF